jgi:hypothetical protein
MHRSSYFRLLRPARLAVALLAFAAFASADSFIDAYNIDSSRGGFMWIDENGAPTNVYAGVIDIALTENGQTYYRDTLCVDLFTDIDEGVTYETQVLDPSMVPGRQLGRVAWLIDNALMPTQNQNYSSVLPSSDWVTSPAQGEGIQLAIWDITNDGGNGLSTGGVQASSDPNNPTPSNVLNWANQYESLSAGHTSNQAFVYNNWALGSLTPAQMLEGPVFKDNGPAPAPEPLTYVLVGTTLVGFGLRRRMVR